MRERQPYRRPIRTRDDLVELIADAVRLQLTWLSKENAVAVADTILRSFKVAGLAIRVKRKQP
jgi:hypothetical protein